MIERIVNKRNYLRCSYYTQTEHFWYYRKLSLMFLFRRRSFGIMGIHWLGGWSWGSSTALLRYGLSRGILSLVLPLSSRRSLARGRSRRGCLCFSWSRSWLCHYWFAKPATNINQQIRGSCVGKSEGFESNLINIVTSNLNSDMKQPDMFTELSIHN